jgi:lipopolysaccharide export system ATP-binding protein
VSNLRANNIVKSYRGRRVVNDVTLEVQSGEVVGLLGPNGAGKTTCFYMVVGLVGCEHGSIKLDGRDITTLPLHRRARLGVGYLPQEPSVFRKLSVWDNVLSVLETRTGLDRHQREKRTGELLRELNIEHLRDNTGISLSGGERRRVEITRALAVDPRFMLLDEPFAGVDPISVIDIREIVEHLAERGIGVLITDHNVRETLGICQRAYILNEGRVISQGITQEVLQNQQVRDVYLGKDFKL